MQPMALSTCDRWFMDDGIACRNSESTSNNNCSGLQRTNRTDYLNSSTYRVYTALFSDLCPSEAYILGCVVEDDPLAPLQRA